MAKLIYGLNQSLDGYVDHDHEAFSTSPALLRFHTNETERMAGAIYGSTMYGLMRYWDDDQPAWDAGAMAYAKAWRKMPKWVVSNSLASVGPNATLVTDQLESAIRSLKAEYEGDFEVAGTKLAQSLTNLGLIDEYHIYLHPVVLGSGTPYFAGPRPPLRLASHKEIDDNVIKLVYLAD